VKTGKAPGAYLTPASGCIRMPCTQGAKNLHKAARKADTLQTDEPWWAIA